MTTEVVKTFHEADALPYRACVAFGIEPTHVSWHSGKDSRFVYRVEANGRLLCLKSHGKDFEHVLKMTGILTELQKRGFDAFPEFVPSISEILVVHLDGLVWTLAHWVKNNQSFSPCSIQIAGNIGRTLGKFHRLSQGIGHNMIFSRAAVRMTSIVRSCRFVMSLTERDLGDGVGRRLAGVLPLYKEEARRVINSLYDNKETFRKVWTKVQAEGELVHGDVSPDNVLVSDPEKVFFVDWDNCRAGMRLDTDLVQFFWRIARVTKDIENVMAQYVKECPLSPDEARLFPLLASSVHAFAHCGWRLKRKKCKEEDKAIAKMLLDDNPHEVIESPWKMMAWLME